MRALPHTYIALNVHTHDKDMKPICARDDYTVMPLCFHRSIFCVALLSSGVFSTLFYLKSSFPPLGSPACGTLYL